MRLIWSETAVRDLREVRSTIAETDPQAAQFAAITILQAARRHSDFPASGRACRIPNTRELVVPGRPFILPYTVRDNVVIILAVMHLSRKWPEAF